MDQKIIELTLSEIEIAGKKVANVIFDEVMETSTTLKEFSENMNKAEQKYLNGGGVNNPPGSMIQLYLRELKNNIQIKIIK